MAYFPSINLAHVAYVSGVAGITTFAANVLAKLIPLHVNGFSARPRSQVSTAFIKDPSATIHLTKIVIHFCGTFEDALPERSTGTIRKHLNNPSIQVIEVTQSRALAALEEDQQPKTILGLSAPNYVVGGYDHAVKQLQKILQVTDEQLTETLKKSHLIFTGFSQGGGAALQVAHRFLDTFNLEGKNISAVSINGSVHGSMLTHTSPSLMLDFLANFCTCFSDFKKGSQFFQQNAAAINRLAQQECSVELLHHHLDLLLLPADAGGKKLNISSTEIALALFGFLTAAYLTKGDASWIPFTACLASSFFALTLSNHIFSPMAPGVGKALRNIIQPTIAE